MAKDRKRQKAERAMEVLPDIPLCGEMGIRLQAITETFEALDKVKGIHIQLQDEETRAMAEEIGVPALYVSQVCGSADLITNDRDVIEYVEWRQSIARKAVA
jgi:hypothetical protein